MLGEESSSDVIGHSLASLDTNSFHHSKIKKIINSIAASILLIVFNLKVC